jgi:hypothetical protein
MNVRDIKTYENTMKEIEKTKLDTQLNLDGNKIIAEIYTLKV